MTALKLILTFAAYVAVLYALGYILHLTGLFGERDGEGLELLQAIFFATVFTVGFYAYDWYKERKIKKG